jgi:hypothetical protein
LYCGNSGVVGVLLTFTNVTVLGHSWSDVTLASVRFAPCNRLNAISKRVTNALRGVN